MFPLCKCRITKCRIAMNQLLTTRYKKHIHTMPSSQSPASDLSSLSVWMVLMEALLLLTKRTVLNKELPQLQQSCPLLSGAWRASTNLKSVHKECDVNTRKCTYACLCTQHTRAPAHKAHTHTHKHECTYSHMPAAAVGGPRRGRNTLMDNDRVWQQESELSHSGRAGNE